MTAYEFATYAKSILDLSISTGILVLSIWALKSMFYPSYQENKVIYFKHL